MTLIVLLGRAQKYQVIVCVCLVQCFKLKVWEYFKKFKSQRQGTTTSAVSGECIFSFNECKAFVAEEKPLLRA